MSRWIRFVEGEALPGRVTRWWGVRAKDGDVSLGRVEWYSPWRKYCFFPQHDSLVFEQTCLRDIAWFIEEQTAAHRLRKAQLIAAKLAGSGAPADPQEGP